MAEETERLLDVEDGSSPLSAGKRSSASRKGLIAAVLLLAAGVVGVAMYSSTSSSSSSHNGLPQLSEEEDFPSHYKLSFISDYFTDGQQPGNGLYPWRIAEIFRENTIQISDRRADTAMAFNKYRWHVNEELVGETYTHEHTHTFTKTGLHTLKIEMFDQQDDESPKETVSTSVMVRYIKRELRELSQEDRQTFLDALETVYRVHTAEGRQIYGEGYKGIETLVAKHMYGAAQRDCDHWHDGAGIMTHHLAYTIEMELVLQSIDPSITIPYWEYTLDTTRYGRFWEESPIFNDDWFGHASPDTPNHALVEGRFGKIKMYSGYDEDFSPFSNPYGQLRSPWNTVNTEYAITRNNKLFTVNYDQSLPGCSTLKTCYDTTTEADLNFCLGGAFHGPVHIMIGGQWGMDLGEFGRDTIVHSHLLFFKNLWRRGIASCPDTCDDDDTCECSCSDTIIEKLGGAYNVLTTHSHILEYITDKHVRYDSETGKFYIPGKTQEEQDYLWAEILHLMCNPGKVGEMYTSAAPWDPTFWVIHTTAERMLQYRRLLAYYGIVGLQPGWGYEDAVAPSDIGVVCDWADVDEEFGLPSCIKETCSGHKAEDILPWDFSELSPAMGSPTNVQLYNFVGPISEELPYVYDNFLWGHCADGDSLGDDVADDGADSTSSILDARDIFSSLVEKGVLQN